MKWIVATTFLLFSLVLPLQAQGIASAQEIMSAFNGANILITDNSPTKTIVANVHYCTNKEFTMDITETTRSQMGGEQSNSWRVTGIWRLHQQNGYNCIHYTYDGKPTPHIEPIYKDAQGMLYIHGKEMEKLGIASCN